VHNVHLAFLVVLERRVDNFHGFPRREALVHVTTTHPLVRISVALKVAHPSVTVKMQI
jgi:hypothetical protein